MKIFSTTINYWFERKYCKIFALAIFVLMVFYSCKERKNREKRVLVFSKTVDFRHESIKDGKEMFLMLGKQHDFRVDTTENPGIFVEDSLDGYSAIIFLNTTGDVLDHAQESSLKRYVQAGGGFMGVHGASGAEYNWPWYGKLVGARFESHPPELQKGGIYPAEVDHAAIEGLPTPWIFMEEWYNFTSISPNINVLATVNESSYDGGKHGDNHPIFWYQEFDGGKSFYTALGHRPEAYSDTIFKQHIMGGLDYVIGNNSPLDYSMVATLPAPDERHFKRTVLLDSSYVSEPMELALAEDGGIFYIERKGGVRKFDPQTQEGKLIGTIPVYHKYEDGLLGLTLDPDFVQNRWLYVMYSAPGKVYDYHISRFALDSGGMLDMESEKVLLTVHQEHSESNHTGGSMAFGPKGNLFIAIGDNTNPFGDSHGYAPIDERPGRTDFDAQRSSGNTDDLRGKILRIHPEKDGSYTIPEGNLFPKDGSKGRPEIFVMGTRNSFRISIDPKTAWLYWGDVGPDAGKDSIQGTRGYDEINQARKAGNFGWPYFVGNNKAFNDVDFATGNIGETFDPKAPVNESPRNTGSKKLPPAEPAFIYYPYVKSTDFPLVGEGGRTAMAGPVYHYDPNLRSEIKFPSYYDGGIFIYDWMRNWIMVVRTDSNGDYSGMEPFMPTTDFVKIIDMELGPDGALYILEYGKNWYSPNINARLSRLEYHNEIPQKESDFMKAVGNVGNTQPAHQQYEGDENNGGAMLQKSDCMACHAINQKSVGPSFYEIATAYEDRPETVDNLSNKVIVGGSGVWGQSPMSAHPQLSKTDVDKMVKYILSFKDSVNSKK